MLAIPRLLQELLTAGRWPRNGAEAHAQNSKPLVSPERVRSLAPDESLIYLLPPPFRTVREQSAQNRFWHTPMADPDGIDFDLALDIGDFGLGSDAPILLDYRLDASNPCVIRLWWPGNNQANQWVMMAKDFYCFVEVLGL